MLKFCFILSVLFWLGLSTTNAAAPVQTATFSLTWTDTNTGEDGSYVENSPTATGTFTQIGSVGPNVVKYTHTVANDPGNVQQCYRVRAYNKAGISGPSNVACATSPTVVLIPDVPGGVAVSVTVTVTTAPPAPMPSVAPAKKK